MPTVARRRLWRRAPSGCRFPHLTSKVSVCSANCSVGSMREKSKALISNNAAIGNNGALYPPKYVTKYPNATDEAKEPTCPAIFIVPLTVPAYFRPTSRQTAHETGSMQSIEPYPSVRKTTAIHLSGVTAAPIITTADKASPAVPTIRRPNFTPWLLTSRSLSQPPKRLPQAPARKGSVEKTAISPSVSPRPFCKYVWSQER